MLQQQIALGIELSKKVGSKEVTSDELLGGVLTGDEGRDDLYNAHVAQFGVSSKNKFVKEQGG